jgi:hypothetical protein
MLSVKAPFLFNQTAKATDAAGKSTGTVNPEDAELLKLLGGGDGQVTGANGEGAEELFQDLLSKELPSGFTMEEEVANNEMLALNQKSNPGEVNNHLNSQSKLMAQNNHSNIKAFTSGEGHELAQIFKSNPSSAESVDQSENKLLNKDMLSQLQTNPNILKNSDMNQSIIDGANPKINHITEANNPKINHITEANNPNLNMDKLLENSNGLNREEINNISKLLNEKPQKLSNDLLVNEPKLQKLINPNKNNLAQNKFNKIKVTEQMPEETNVSELFKTSELNSVKQNQISKYVKNAGNDQLIQLRPKNNMSNLHDQIMGKQNMMSQLVQKPIEQGIESSLLGSESMEIDISGVPSDKSNLIVNKMSEYMKLYKPNNGQIKLDFYHEDLGRMEVKLQEKNQQVQIQIEAQNKSTFSMLKNNSDHLLSVLKNSGVMVSDLSIDQNLKSQYMNVHQMAELDSSGKSNQFGGQEHHRGQDDNPRQQKELWDYFNQGAYA